MARTVSTLSLPAAALLAAALSLSAVPPAAADAGAELDAALAALRAGDYDACIAHATLVPADAELFPRAQYVVGEARLLVHDYAGAELAFLQVLEHRPEAQPAVLGLGRSLLERQLFAEAEVHLGAAVELAPDDPAALRALAELLMRTRRLDEAREILDGLQADAPDDPQSVRARVELELRAQDLDAAGAAARALSGRLPAHPMGPFLEGIVHEQRQETDAAIAAYGEALRRDERFLDAHKNLAILGHTLSDTYRIEAMNRLAAEHYARYFELGGRDAGLKGLYETLRRAVPQFAGE